MPNILALFIKFLKVMIEFLIKPQIIYLQLIYLNKFTKHWVVDIKI